MIRTGSLVLYRCVGLKHIPALVIKGPFEKIRKDSHNNLVEIIICFDIYADGEIIYKVPKSYLRTFAEMCV